MIPYASNTRTRSNLLELKRYNWRIMIAPTSGKPAAGFRYAIDNGAWRAYTTKTDFDGGAFERTVDRFGMDADFVVLPDIVMGGNKSLAFSLSWISKLAGLRLLLPVQDGMTPAKVKAALSEFPSIGIFIGGSTYYKLETMRYWGDVCRLMGRWCHCGRVNSRRRIRLCHEAGLTSFDGSGVSRFGKDVARLDAERRQPSLLSSVGAIHQ